MQNVSAIAEAHAIPQQELENNLENETMVR